MTRLHSVAWTWMVALGLILPTACTVAPPGSGKSPVDARSAPTAAAAMARIEGTVAFTNGDPSGIDVAAYPVQSLPSGPSFATKTDDGGRFALSVPVGTYNVIATKPGTTYRAVKWSIQSATTVEINLTPTGTIAGTITANPATDLSGTLVFVPGTSFVAAADAHGGYTMTGIPIGTVSIEVLRSGYGKGTLPSVTVQAGQITTAGAIDLVMSSLDDAPGISPPGQIGSAFVGEAACELCHVGEAAAYKQTVHYRIGNDPSYNGSWAGKANLGCRSCHTVGEDMMYHASPSATPVLVNGLAAGFDYARNAAEKGTGPWLDVAATAPFNGIQCENCHGPGGNHVAVSMSDPDLIAKKLNTITVKPSYAETCVKCHTTTAGNVRWLNGAYVPWTNGATDDDVNAGGAGAVPHHPQALAYQQSGGYTFGQTFASNAHNKLGNGCIDCHVSGTPGLNHDINIAKKRAAVIANVCSKCHGATMTPDSIQNYQALTKMALANLEDLMIAYRQAFCRQVLVGSATSSAAADLANLGNKATLWDDTPSGVTKVTGSPTTWSPHQTHFNAANWNADLVSENGDKSWGIHAPTYEQSLLRLAHNALVIDMGQADPVSTGSYSILSLKH